MPTTRERLIQIIDDWADDPESYEQWGSLLKVNVLIQAEKEFGIQFNSADIPNITGLNSLMAYLEPRLAGKKVLVLDCDGVLWDGIVGEGTANVTGMHRLFQECAINLEVKGVLLCLCSKNNEKDVWDAFDSLPNMVIHQTHLVAEEISWDSKVDGLRRLAAKLNLGLDSFVFVDNSDAEIEEVRQALPEVHCLRFYPRQWEETTNYLKSIFPKQGHSKTLEYINAMQTREEQAAEPYDQQGFLDSLNMVAEMRVNDESLIPRIAELSQKTNQFNMTLRRFTEHEIRSKMDNEQVFCASLTDRFGDAGWVAQAVFVRSLETWQLEDLCISCRVLGRGFERAFVEKCVSMLPDTGIPFQWHYTHGPKNKPCWQFFEGDKVSDLVPRAPVTWKNAAQPSPESSH